jgi:SnoaL-like domain
MSMDNRYGWLLALAACFSTGITRADVASELETLKKQVATLQAKVDKQEAIDAGRTLGFMYGYFMDNGLYDQVKTLFADKMEYCEISGYGLYKGRKGCELVWEKVVGQPPIRDANGRIPFGRLSRHQMMKDIVHVAEDGMSADGRFDYMGMGGELGREQAGGFQLGIYRMRFVKERGVWKISRFSLVFDVMDFRPGQDWTKTVAPLRCPPPGRPAADGPYTFFHPFPEVGIVPFEFPNPVTGGKIPDWVNPTRYWQGNWPGEFGGACGKRANAPEAADTSRPPQP